MHWPWKNWVQTGNWVRSGKYTHPTKGWTFIGNFLQANNVISNASSKRLNVMKIKWINILNNVFSHLPESGWLGQAMVLGSFQCQGVLLLWHMVGQGPAVLAAGAGQVCCFFIFFISSILSSFSNASSLGRRLDILKYCGLGRYNPTVGVS